MDVEKDVLTENTIPIKIVEDSRTMSLECLKIRKNGEGFR